MKLFLTSREDGNGKFVGYVTALNWEHAERICGDMNPVPTVEGVVGSIVWAPLWASEDAVRFARALAMTGDETPDASEFRELK